MRQSAMKVINRNVRTSYINLHEETYLTTSKQQEFNKVVEIARSTDTTRHLFNYRYIVYKELHFIK